VTVVWSSAGVPARIVAPLVGAFVLFLGIVAVSVRPHARTVERVHGWRRFVRRLVSTALGGYAVFVAIVLVFHRVLAGQRDVMAGAAQSGAVLAFAIALPAFVALSVIEAGIRNRRR
jgi:hypothetical protein